MGLTEGRGSSVWVGFGTGVRVSTGLRVLAEVRADGLMIFFYFLFFFAIGKGQEGEQW